MKDLKWKRVLLKLSGEALMGDGEFGISPEILKFVANEINDVCLKLDPFVKADPKNQPDSPTDL